MRDSPNRGTVVVGVGGGVAAYKAGDLVRRLRAQGLRVRVAMTPMAARFVSPLTFQALSGEPVLTDLADPSQDAAFGHLDLARSADLGIVAPATADLLGKLANGLADDPVTTTLIAAKCPLLVCPAMNTAMWENPRVRRNLESLQADARVKVIGPGVGVLADGDVGAGRLAEVPEIVRAALGILGLAQLAESASPSDGEGGLDLEGHKLLLTAGPTREPIDPVRFLSNPSSGRMGYALAAAAARRGAEVVLISGPVDSPAPAGVKLVRIETAEQLRDAALAALPGCAAVIAAAAVSDFRPRKVLAHKKKKAGSEKETLDLVRTPDVLLALSQVARKGPAGLRPVLVGFAAETDDLVDNALRKLVEKRLDLVVANQVGGEGSAFGADDNEVTLVSVEQTEELPRMSKALLAEKILDRVVKLLAR